MFKLEYKIGNRTVSEDEFLKNFEESALSLAHSAVEERVSSVRCPIHGQSPSNFRVLREGENISYEFTACCERLRSAVWEALK